MNQMHITRDGDIIIFCDQGIVLHYRMEGKLIRRYYPYGSIQSIKVETLLLGVVFQITAKDVAKNGNNFMNGFSFYKADRAELEKSVAFAKSKMETAQHDNMVQNDSGSIPKAEEQFIWEATKYHAEKREQNRVKYRNIGLAVMLISFIAILYACSSTGLGILAVLAVFVGFIGFFIFANNIKPPAQIIAPKAKSGTKEIIKGAIVGGIIAGEAGAIVGAAIAKNNLDNKK